MAKVKLSKFEIVAIKKDGKKIIDHLQKLGVAQLENLQDEDLVKSKAEEVIDQAQGLIEDCSSALSLIEKYAKIKKSLVEQFADYKQISYSEYKTLSSRCQRMTSSVSLINSLENQIQQEKEKLIQQQVLIDYHMPWIPFDLPMCSSRTATTTIYVGSFDFTISSEEIETLISEKAPELEEFSFEIVSQSKMHTCVLFIAHNSIAKRFNEVICELGFIKTENPAKKLASKVVQQSEEEILKINQKIDKLKNEIAEFSSVYQDIRFMFDFLNIQKEKYLQLENTASSQKTIFIQGYLPKIMADELKFEFENKYLCEFDYCEPDYENEDVPVLIENGGFASGVESVTNLYSPPSNRDIDPNPIMAFFYYMLFGLMLSDAGYGLLMVIMALVAKYKLKVRDNMRKTANFGLYCGLGTMFWGAMFGGWFGDVFQTVSKTFFGVENPPSLAIWFEPINNSMTLLMFSFLIGLIHLFTGLAIKCYILAKRKEYVAAIFDVFPTVIFVVGFAIIGGNLLTPFSPEIAQLGAPCLAIGSILIVLTAGRSSKKLGGKIGGGFFELYNTVSGYLGDILSYSRLLALCLVTGVIANVVNMLGAMMNNIILFAVIFVFGHTVNIAINLIGTYVHTNRLQYVEFFSKFYEGMGRMFKPFRLNSKYYIIKEEKINE